MGETIDKIKKQLNEFWSGLNKGKKIKLGIGALLIVLAITAIIIFTTRESYETLYSGLTDKELGAVTRRLDEMGISYKLTENPNTISVPSDQRKKTNATLAEEGLPNPIYKFTDAFNDSSWTMTDKEKDRIYNYALQNELSSTIAEINGIEKASVYLQVPEEKGFVIDDDRQATASVYIEKSKGANVSSKQVEAIQNWVASSIGMEAKNVSVIDETGSLISDYDSKNSGQFDVLSQLNIKNNIQSRINFSITNFLEQVYGEGNVDVRANVEVDFDKQVTSIVEFQPPVEGSEQGLIRSMQKLSEDVIDDGAEGVPGEDENGEDIPNYVSEDQLNSKYSKASETINYELNEINKEIQKAPGDIKSVTVAVLINKDAIDGEFTNSNKKEVEELIYAATGLNTKQVAVNASSFLSQRDNTENTNIVNEKGGNSIWKILTFAFALLAVGGIAGIIISKRKKKDNYNIEELIEEKTDENSHLEDIDFDTEKSEYKGKINEFVDKKPEAVAQLLRSWLNED
ncbi:flagellar basal-body MS-ring/collar protein FliF [Dethiothermospora halolimnae]|uniref:flagellar basal-body MS-ring/collar protein FliF n=1 Tax=Dethiothermospora halolimnae TaxID=3114390 RepID=UPI003CCC38E5